MREANTARAENVHTRESGSNAGSETLRRWQRRSRSRESPFCCLREPNCVASCCRKSESPAVSALGLIRQVHRQRWAHKLAAVAIKAIHEMVSERG